MFNSEKQNLLPFNGSAYLYENAFAKSESDYYLSVLQQEILWKQEPIKIFGKEVMQPRLTAWYGDEGKSYRYSGITMTPLPWTPSLVLIKKRAELLTGYSYNSCLLNQYRNEKDSMGWHRDNEKELGPEPAIASISFGATRMFRFRNYEDKKNVISIQLAHGSLLLMSGTTQVFWQHALPVTKISNNIRINLTFRNIL